MNVFLTLCVGFSLSSVLLGSEVKKVGFGDLAPEIQKKIVLHSLDACDMPDETKQAIMTQFRADGFGCTPDELWKYKNSREFSLNRALMPVVYCLAHNTITLDTKKISSVDWYVADKKQKKTLKSIWHKRQQVLSAYTPGNMFPITLQEYRSIKKLPTSFNHALCGEHNYFHVQLKLTEEEKQVLCEREKQKAWSFGIQEGIRTNVIANTIHMATGQPLLSSALCYVWNYNFSELKLNPHVVGTNALIAGLCYHCGIGQEYPMVSALAHGALSVVLNGAKGSYEAGKKTENICNNMEKKLIEFKKSTS